MRPSPEGAEAEQPQYDNLKYDIPQLLNKLKHNTAALDHETNDDCDNHKLEIIDEGTENSGDEVEDKSEKKNIDGVMIINRSFEEPPPVDIKEDFSYDPNISIDSLCSSNTNQLDISVDSLNTEKVEETSFDDNDNIIKTTTGGKSLNKSVIHNEGDKTIILSSGLVSQNSSQAATGNRQDTCNVTISSSSWINIENGNANVTANSGTVIANAGEIRLDEPVKPPRLKKLARQQSKQEAMRSKSLITGIVPELSSNVINNNNINSVSNVNNSELIKSKSRPEISPPILINSTLNQTDLESHKCIHLNSEEGEDSSRESPYRGASVGHDLSDMCSETGSSFYTLESVLDETYRSRSVASNSDIYTEHIYEEIIDSRLKVRPLPPIPEANGGSSNGASRTNSPSIFTGATKSEILHYLNDARLRISGGGSGGNESDSAMSSSAEDHYSTDGFLVGSQMRKPHRISAVSNLSDSSNSSNDSVTESSVLWRGNSMEKITGLICWRFSLK